MEPIGLCALVQGVLLELDEELAENDEQRELLQELISNSKLSEGYLTLARDLDVMEPKTPDDIYKVC
jgi:26S proteasome regulatory subunit N1